MGTWCPSQLGVLGSRIWRWATAWSLYFYPFFRSKFKMFQNGIVIKIFTVLCCWIFLFCLSRKYFLVHFLSCRQRKKPSVKHTWRGTKVLQCGLWTSVQTSSLRGSRLPHLHNLLLLSATDSSDGMKDNKRSVLWNLQLLRNLSIFKFHIHH